MRAGRRARRQGASVVARYASHITVSECVCMVRTGWAVGASPGRLRIVCVARGTARTARWSSYSLSHPVADWAQASTSTAH